ncbi:MAG: SdiA-regulated domain-containing protein [Patescibacteria group bacterium]|nr:SdiA-regulated domain-containing protein [Patescibacteria group bacterium]
MKTFVARLSIIIFFLVAFPWCCFAIDAWPGSAGATIATLSDASGAVWHEARQSLFVVQNTGTLDELDSGGGLKDSWAVAGDPEGITLAENDRYLYIGIENPDSIAEFDLQTEALTGKSWDLTTWMTGPPNSGLEGLAYRNGYFYAGLQADGKIYVFNVNLNVSGDVSHVQTITPNASYTSDISGIEVNSNTGITYVIYDTYDALLELNASNEIVNYYSLPGTAQEGIALKTNCLSRTADVYIANDDTGLVVKYTDYPIACLDADSDGVDHTSDCNDYDSTISANQTYYRDIDSDGLGDANTTSAVCSLSAPEGYVANSSDPADISASGRSFYVNGNNYDFFTVDPTTVQYTDLNFYGDDYQEIIAAGLVSKKAYITLARVRGNEVAVTKRVKLKIKKKHTSVSTTTQSSKYKFTTRFSRGKKYTWKVKSSGSFSRSH